MVWHFPPFRLDTSTNTLWRGDTRIRLHPRPVAVLEQLVRHAGDVVAVDALLRDVWHNTYVTVENVKVCVNKIRRALDDDVRHPTFIETRAGRGYRFIGPVTLERQPHMTTQPALVGRDAALLELQRQLAHANRGHRQVVFVTGGAGTGKTALCERFLQTLDAPGGLPWVGRGRCSRDMGTEPFLPIAQALSDMCRTNHDCLSTLERLAPSWVPHLSGVPGRGDVAAAEQARRQAGWATRMVRELNVMFDAVARRRTVILLIDDLQASDRRTIELLGAMGGRSIAGRLLVLVTIRPDEPPASAYALATMRVTLRLRHRAAEITLAPLQTYDLVEYLAARFADEQLASALAPILYRSTAGNPLLMQTALGRLESSGLLERSGAGWRLHRSDLPLEHIMSDRHAALHPAVSPRRMSIGDRV